MSTLMDIIPDQPRVNVDVNTNGDNARQATREYRVYMSKLMEIMPDKPRVSIDVNTNGDNADKPRVSIDVNTNGDTVRPAKREY